jgi:hypothetical protein
MIHRIASVVAALLLAGCVQAGTVTKPVAQNGAAPRLSRGEEGAIRDKVWHCWGTDPAKPVKLRIDRVRPDGTVAPNAISVIDDGGDPRLAERAVRAVLNPSCQPWPKPSGGWPDDSFIVVFD